MALFGKKGTNVIKTPGVVIEDILVKSHNDVGHKNLEACDRVSSTYCSTMSFMMSLMSELLSHLVQDPPRFDWVTLLE